MLTVAQYIFTKLAQIGGQAVAPVFGTPQPGTNIAGDPMQQTLGQIQDYKARQGKRVERFRKMVKTKAALKSTKPLDPDARNVLAPQQTIQPLEAPNADSTPVTSEMGKSAGFWSGFSGGDETMSQGEFDTKARTYEKGKQEFKSMMARVRRDKAAGKKGDPIPFQNLKGKKRATAIAGMKANIQKEIGTKALPGWLGASRESTVGFQKAFRANTARNTRATREGLEAARKAMGRSALLRRGGLALGVGGAILGARALRRKMRKDIFTEEKKLLQENEQGGQMQPNAPPQQPQQFAPPPATPMQPMPQPNMIQPPRKKFNLPGVSQTSSWINDQFNPGGSPGQLPVIKTGSIGGAARVPENDLGQISANLRGLTTSAGGTKFIGAVSSRPRKLFTKS